MSPALSVVIPTFRRPDLLERCLAAAASQDLDRQAYEIIVVNDGPDAVTRHLVESRAQRMTAGPRIRYLAMPGRCGPAAARNRGWHAAEGSIIAFTDDDTIPERQWLREGCAALTPEWVAVWGRVRVPVPPAATDYERDAGRLDNAEFVTANCFVRRSALVTVGGFDERFRAAWREDSDLFFSLLERAGRVAPAPRAVVLHPVRPARWGVSLAQQRKVLFDALLFKKHPRLYREKIRPAPPWAYYAIVSSLLAGVAAFAAGWLLLGSLAMSVWLALSARFCWRRLANTSRAARHVLEMIVTSVAIPPLAVFWRLAGALRFRVLFV
jgi:GT2 family glycosyltransferase